ncbi:MAG: hypothetical protein CR982_01765 [Candidatus Cloacimonadota bacterium]|nr:MAG: hypothetical protein CR982_01765 [Candidatus Cloacimonadota bacterium]PIE77449.1 MAG: hypothetical protein CSA15_12885 [Candidatus Delongbacteria bacterium]
MANIELKVDWFSPEKETVLIRTEDYYKDGDLYRDDYLGLDFSPTFLVTYDEKKILREFFTEAGMEDLIKEIKPGNIDRLKGLYDIPEWKLYDLTAGEAVLHAWVQAYRRYPLESVQKKVREACKTLRRGELRFKEILEAKKGFLFGNFPTK